MADESQKVTAATAKDVYRQARDQAASQAEYDVQDGLDRLTQWMRRDEPGAKPGLRVVPADPASDADATRPGQSVPETGRLSDRPEDFGYRGPAACAAAGINYRQLDYWARTGLVEPTVRAAHGNGSQRLYGFRDIVMLKTVKRLLDTGVSLQQIRAAISSLQNRGVGDLAQITLLSDGKSIYECTSSGEVVDLLEQGQVVFGLALGAIWQETEGILAELPAERTVNTSLEGKLTYQHRDTDLPDEDEGISGVTA
jgi:DNA-binding transcriptional MerR regulator